MILCFIADGRSIHTQRWVEYFAQRGHEVHLITYDPVGRTIPGVTEYVLTSRWNNLYLSFIPRHLTIKRLVKKIKPDLIHAHFIAKYGFHLPGLRFSPTVVSAWGDDVLILPNKSWLIRYYTKMALSSATLVYAVSRDIQNHILVDFKIPASKVRYLPFGIDTELFVPDPDGLKNSRVTIEIFSNRGFYPVYDNETLIRGFAQAYRLDSRLRLTLKGEGPEEQEIRDLVRSLGLLDCVRFRQKTEYAEVPWDLQQADIFITTSISDGTPVSVLEAMASGLPCIATSLGGIPEWIVNNETGLLVESGSPEQVAQAIHTLAADPGLRMRMGTAARGVIVLNGQWKTLMVQAEKDYQELIKTYKQDRP
ncbi:MAG: glycosyltransferase [Methanoregula sp.]|uniref:glycosyltransferase n=1 Tax=Methanoregula sp. TaxID=2052170 RepID=UPI003D0C0C8A